MSTITLPRRTLAMADLCAEIATYIGSAPNVGRRKLQELAADARLPGAYSAKGRWYVYADAVPEIIRMLGLQAA